MSIDASATKSPLPDPIEAGWADGWRIDPPLTVSAWADANVVLSSKDSSEPGPYRTARTPYAREIADCLSPHSPIETVVWIAGAQLAKTRVGLNWMGAVIDAFPGPMLMVQPTVETAKKVSKQRIATMIESTAVLRGKVKEARTRDSGNTMFEKEFPGGMLMLTGANSAVGLRSMPIRYLFLDEVDAYPGDVDGEGDPVELAKKRTSTFSRRKIFMTSTPTLKGLSRIEAEFGHSDQRRYFVPCPHCRFLDYIRWENIQWEEHKPETARLVCRACGVLIEERFKTWMLDEKNGAEWRATAQGDGKTAGFHLSTLYAPLGWRSWADIVAEFLKAKQDTAKLKTWVNTVLGETWEERGDSLDATGLRGRLEDYGAEVPHGVGVLTCTVDVQGDRLEAKVKGWGAGEESWLIALHAVHGDPAKETTWFELDQFLISRFTHASGRELSICVVLIDSGGLHTEHVYRFVKPRETRRLADGTVQHVNALKGVAGAGREILGRPSTGNRYQVKLFPIGVDTAKDTVFSRLQNTSPGPGYMHLPALVVDDEYLDQLTAEKAVRRYKKGVGVVREYVKLRERNEGLDLEVYSLAALYRMGRQFIATLGQLAEELSKPGGPTPPEDDSSGGAPPRPSPSWGGSGRGGGWVQGWR